MFGIARLVLFVVGSVAVLAGFGMATATPVNAQTACNNNGNVVVEFLGVGTSNTILMAQLDNYYQGNVSVRVYCNEPGQPLVTGAQVAMRTSVPGSEILVNGVWTPATTSDVLVNVASGEGIISVRSAQPGIPVDTFKARVGTNEVRVTQAYGSAINPNDLPSANGAMWAQTPELDSVLLLGAGLLALVVFGARRVRRAVRP